MPSTYSPNLHFELIANGEQANTWGTTTNNNIGSLIEQAIAGVSAIDVTAGDVWMTSFNGAVDQARSMFIQITGSPASARNVYCLTGNTKVYVVINSSSQTVNFGSSTGSPNSFSGAYVSIAAGTSLFVYSDSINVYPGVTSITGLTASRAAVTNSSGSLTVSSVTATELGYLSGVTSAIQTQLGTKAPTTSGSSILAGNSSGGFNNVTVNSTLSYNSSTATLGLPTTGVTAKAYTNANITVDAYGRITVASDGSGGGGGGTVTGVSVATSNGFYGNSSGGATPSLTLATTVNGILKSTGSVISPAGISAATSTDIVNLISTAYVANATHATSADSATTATTANSANSANSATTAGSASTATTATQLSGGYTASSFVLKSGDTMSGQLVLSASVAGQGTTKSTNTNSTAGSYGLAGFGAGGGVYGEATGAYYTSHGVYGTSALGYGVYGRNTLGNSFGLSGGYFTNSTSGIYSYIADNYYGVYTNGVVYAQGSTLPSDERLKENSHPIQGALYIIENLHPVSFDWKISTYRGKRQNAPVPDFGFIAQEVELVLPELVYDVETPQDNSDPNKALEEQLGTHKSMDYVKLIPFLTAAIQELNAKVDAQAAEIAVLKGA